MGLFSRIWDFFNDAPEPDPKPEWEIERDRWVAGRDDGKMLHDPNSWPTEEEWPLIKKWQTSSGTWPDPYIALEYKDPEEQVVYDYWARASQYLWGTKRLSPPPDGTRLNGEFPKHPMPDHYDEATGKFSDLNELIKNRKPMPPRSGFWNMRKAAPLSRQEQQDLEAVRIGKLKSGIAITGVVSPELKKREKLYWNGALVFIEADGNTRKATKQERKKARKGKIPVMGATLPSKTME